MNLDEKTLVVFGDFGVLTNTPFRDKAPLSMLPGRAEYLAWLNEDRAQRGGPELQYAVMCNKGGVAFGLSSEAEAKAEAKWTAEQIGAKIYKVCFAHPNPTEGYEQYADADMLKGRKPEPGMLLEILKQLGVSKEKALVVGNYADDCKAAMAAGVAYEVASKFFRDAEQYVKTAPLDPSVPPVDDFDPWLDVE